MSSPATWTAENVLEVYAAITTGFSLYFGWRTYRLRMERRLFDLPFIVPAKFQNGAAPVLDGTNAQIWKIDRVIISKPRGAVFLKHDAEYDTGGSIVSSTVIELGRKIDVPELPIYVRSESWPVTLEFVISLRSSPSIKRSLVVRMSE